MTYESLMDRLKSSTPALLTYQNEPLAKIVDIGVKIAFKTITLGLEVQERLRVISTVQHLYEHSPHFGMGQLSDWLAIEEIELSSGNTHAIQKTIESLEDGIIDLYGLGEVGKAFEYAEIYRVLSEHILHQK